MTGQVQPRPVVLNRTAEVQRQLCARTSNTLRGFSVRLAGSVIGSGIF